MTDKYDRLLQGIELKVKETLQNDIEKRWLRKRPETSVQTILSEIVSSSQDRRPGNNPTKGCLPLDQVISYPHLDVKDLIRGRYFAGYTDIETKVLYIKHCFDKWPPRKSGQLIQVR